MKLSDQAPEDWKLLLANLAKHDWQGCVHKKAAPVCLGLRAGGVF